MPISQPDTQTNASLVLPAVPEHLQGPVKAWSEPVVLPTYLPAEGDRNPMFLEKRVYRGSTVQVYPLPLIDRISTEPQMHTWQAVHIENEFIRVMILPEIGGRIHVALDKTTGYDFFYRQDVIKPALVGLAGPWLPGGVEFNWPQQHSPATFTPTSVHIEEHTDGSRTIWCSHYDSITRMKGMHGICLYPGRAYIEVKVRLFNCTSLTKTFSWSANAALRVAEHYRSFVAEDFLGEYHHEQEAGLVHVANHHVAPGKKQWSLAPYETKTFSQFWYPIQRTGPPHKANVDAAVRLQVDDDRAHIGVAVTSAFPAAVITLEWNGVALGSWTRDLAPGRPLVETAVLQASVPSYELTLKVITSKSRELISYTPLAPIDPATREKAEPEVASPTPRKLATNDELYLTGLHHAQCHQAGRSPEEYWLEAVRRDPNDSRCHLALGILHLHRGEFQEAEEHLRRAIATLTTHEMNSRDGEAHYHLGLCLCYLGRDEEAYDALYKSTWNFGWRAPALFAIAELELKFGRWEQAPKHLYEALRLNADNNDVRNLATVIFRRFGRTAQADALLAETLALDPMDAWASHLAGRPIPGDNQVRLDVAFNYIRAGLYAAALEILNTADLSATDGSVPIVHYVLAFAYLKLGDASAADRAYAAGSNAPPQRCFPYRLEELLVLQNAVSVNPTDARAFYYLGNWLYAHRRYEQATDCWEIATRLDPGFATAWRNFGVALFNARHDVKAALAAYDSALAAAPDDARVLYERDQLCKRAGIAPQRRLEELEAHRALVDSRDDLSIELAGVYNATYQPDRAAAIFKSRQFQPLVDGENLVVAQFVRTQLKLGQRALEAGNVEEAQAFFRAAVHPPQNLGEARQPSTSQAEIHYWMGEAASASQNIDAAIVAWQKAAAAGPYSEQTLYQALAKARLGEGRESRTLLRQLWFHGRRVARDKGDTDFVATCPLALLPFHGDLAKQKRIDGLFLQAQARVGLGQWKLARRALAQVLALDPSHERAIDALRSLPR